MENVANAQALVKEFHQQYLNKLGSQPMTTHDTHRLKTEDNVIMTSYIIPRGFEPMNL